ncbi:hypothetical protein MettiDRAFT_1731 [Methanolobus tindarius DSM 2278]|uniref:Uncharacterized protein n=2 Tax=Methanolobus tindarius TaxID=2221 RepID=W9DRD5_METTI|nr:hypothetical protein MettiDRAFT_1731 [Methanolobus tindarius DSM 2278]
MQIDYIIGISIFLTSIIFLFSYTSGLFLPFQSNSDEITLIADRISTNIVEQELSAREPGHITILDGKKVSTFFSEINSNYGGILNFYGLNGTYLRYDMNVTIENETSILYSGGKQLPQYSNIAQTKRVIMLKDETTENSSVAVLSVRVW